MKKISFHIVVLILSCLSVIPVYAQGSEQPVYKQTVDKRVDEVYDKVHSSLEELRFYVVFTPNIGQNIARFEQRWGENYNRNNLTEIRSMVFCNAWYANEVSNLDPDMMAFCPLHISLIERDGKTTVLFNRPSAIATASPAKDLFLEIEDKVISALQKGLQ